MGRDLKKGSVSQAGRERGPYLRHSFVSSRQRTLSKKARRLDPEEMSSDRFRSTTPTRFTAPVRRFT